MADTTTPNVGLTKPEVGASEDTWGDKLNDNADTIDALFDTGPVLKVAKGGTGAATASAARTALGLGTVAVKNTGTSGNTVPLLDGANAFSAKQTFDVGVNLGAEAAATIASGVIAYAKGSMTVDTEGSASTDDLDTITGGTDGDILILRPVADSRNVRLRSGGNIRINVAGGGLVTLASSNQTAMLRKTGSLWLALAYSLN